MPIVVRFVRSTFQGTAVIGRDYTFTEPLTVTFDYDASEMSVPLTINNADRVPTADRNISLQLQNPVGGPIVDGKYIIELTITDNGMIILLYPGNDYRIFIFLQLIHLA